MIYVFKTNVTDNSAIQNLQHALDNHDNRSPTITVASDYGCTAPGL